jgi:hypothetical protein
MRLASSYDWRRFHFAARHLSLYILGAGASLPTISNRLGDRIREEVQALGILDGSVHVPSALKEALLPEDIQLEIQAFRSGEISQNEYIAHTPNEVIEAILSRIITVRAVGQPPQYAVFDRFAPSVVFNFNNDNLTDRIDPRHFLLRPHGAIPASFVQSVAFDDALRHLAIPTCFPGWLDYQRPLPEPTDITSRWTYRTLADRFASLHAAVIIGYSFGVQSTGMINDAESFEMLTDMLRWRPRPVLVVDPYPDRVADTIASAVHRNVSVVRCKWNVLAEFILAGRYHLACQASHTKGLQGITSMYRQFEDALDERGLVRDL